MLRKQERLGPRTQVERVDEQLIQPFAKSIRVRKEGADGDRLAVGRPRRPPDFVRRRRLRIGGWTPAVRETRRPHPALVGDVRDQRSIGGPCRRRGAAAALARQLRIAVRGEIVYPHVHAAAAIADERHASAVGRPCRIEIDRRVVRDPRRHAAERHHPEIAERGEGDHPPVRRDRRRDDPLERLRIGRLERTMRDDVAVAMQRHSCGEPDRRRGAADDRPAFEAAVGCVEQLAARQPLRADRKDVLAARQRGDFIRRRMAAVRRVGGHDRVRGNGDERAVAQHERELEAVGTPRRRAAPRRGTDEALAAGEVDGVHAGRPIQRIGRRLSAVGRDEHDLAIVRRPRRHRAVARAAAPRLAVGERELPDRRHAAVAIGGERDPRSVVRPCRFAIVELAFGERLRVAAAARHDVDVPEPVGAVALKRDRLAVGRPRGLPRFERIGGQPPRLAAAHREEPERANEIDRDPPAIGRSGGGHRRSLGERHLEVARRRRLLRAERGKPKRGSDRRDARETTINAETAEHAELLFSRR